jgi:hypothetical protein
VSYDISILAFSCLFIDPSNKNCVGQGKDGEENEVRTNPICALWKGGGEKRGNPAKKGQASESEGNGEKKELGEGVGPATDGINRSSVVPQGSEPEKVSPGMKGNKVGTDGEEWWREVEKEK